jgi:hypothetical protein
MWCRRRIARPNANAYAERFVRAVAEYVAHYQWLMMAGGKR